jgi:hypothetical protein
VPAACQGLADLVPLRDPQRMTRQHQVIAHRYGLQRMIKILVDTYDQYGVRCLS